MTLTEQWKKGELEAGWYYVLCEDEMVMLEWEGDYFLSGDVPLTGDGDVYIKEVLAKVPSYEEWKAAYECQLMESELVLTLKELLKTCKEMLEEYQYSEGDYTIGDNLEMDTSLLLKKIDNAIGEKK